jgi:hypothetical protein
MLVMAQARKGMMAMTRPNWDLKLGKAVSRALKDLPPPMVSENDIEAILARVEPMIQQEVASSLEPICEQLRDLDQRVCALESSAGGSGKPPSKKAKSS